MRKIIIIMALFVFFCSLVYASEYQAMNKINAANLSIDNLKTLGFKIDKINDLYDEALISYEEKRYGAAIKYSEELMVIIDEVNLVYAKINDTKKIIEKAKKYDINIISAENTFRAANYEFSLENFKEADKNIDDSINELKNIVKSKLRELSDPFELIVNKLEFSEIKLSSVDKLKKDFLELNISGNLDNYIIFDNKVKELQYTVDLLVESKNNLFDANIPTTRLVDLYQEAILEIDLGNYKKANEILDNIKSSLDKGIIAEKNMGEINKRIKSQNLDLKSAESLVDEASIEFNKENFDKTLSLLEKADNEIEKAIADNLLFGIVKKNEIKFNLLDFIKKYWWYFLVISIVVLVVSLIFYKSISISMIKRKIKKLEKEQKAIKEMMKKAQRDCFVKKKISQRTYEDLMDHYEERSIKIKETIPILMKKNEHF